MTRAVSGGSLGTRPGAPTAVSGSVGENITTFVPLLNGFLFNSIRSSVTLDQVDSICSNVVPQVNKWYYPGWRFRLIFLLLAKELR